MFLENMSSDKFFPLRSHLHAMDDLNRPADSSNKLYTVRPRPYTELDLEWEFCINEQIIPFSRQLG